MSAFRRLQYYNRRLKKLHNELNEINLRRMLPAMVRIIRLLDTYVSN